MNDDTPDLANNPPTIENAPGLKWRPRVGAWEARWVARTEIVRAGFRPRSMRLMKIFGQPTMTQRLYIQDQCQRMQAEMIVYAGGGLPQQGLQFDGTLHSLIACYRSDPASRYRKIRFQTREYYDRLMNRLEREHGATRLRDIEFRTLLLWHEAWGAKGRVAVAHSMIGMVRTLVNFGLTAIENARAGGECGRLSVLLRSMKFPQAPARSARLTADQATAIRHCAFAEGSASVALAQAIQFEGMLRQKDVIGEWVPVSEDGISQVTFNNMKWLRGIRWNEIDQNMILRHVTSKRSKLVTIDLRSAPMVLEEFARQFPDGIPRDDRPLIISEATGRPYEYREFYALWRRIANECGVPKGVRNMDTRAGAISEATDAGAPLESVRHAATHSDIQMTQRYSRGGEEKAAEVLRLRVEYRDKKGA